MNKTTLKLNASLKKEYVMKVSRMIITKPEIKHIRAFFTLTIGAIVTRDWKLKQYTNGQFRISSPSKIYTNKKGNVEREPLVEVLDSKITDKILELALIEYNFRKGSVQNVNSTN